MGKDKHEENAEELLKYACNYQEYSAIARENSNKQYRNIESNDYNIFRITIDGLIVRTTHQLRSKIENSDEKISYQISIIVSFVRTHFVINDLILGGDLVEACVLIRKQLEALTRLHEIDKGPLRKLLRQTPNVINLFKKSGKMMYPTLSEVAHFATPQVGDLLSVESLEDGRQGPSIFPSYNENAITCYQNHGYIAFYFVFWVISFMKRVYPASYEFENDEKTIMLVLNLALKCKILKLDEGI